jgi:hypothetical protein
MSIISNAYRLCRKKAKGFAARVRAEDRAAMTVQ